MVLSVTQIVPASAAPHDVAASRWPAQRAFAAPLAACCLGESKGRMWILWMCAAMSRESDVALPQLKASGPQRRCPCASCASCRRPPRTARHETEREKGVCVLVKTARK